MAVVARRYGIGTGQLYTWRRQLLQGVMAFRGKRGDRLKVLVWEGSGLCLYAKRLERGRFVWPARRMEPRDGSAPRSGQC